MSLTTAKRGIALLCSVALISGCVAPSQAFLTSMTAQCTSGDQSACNQLPGLRAQVSAEHQQQTNQFLLGMGAVALGAAAAAAASQPRTEYVVVCPRWRYYC
jgi:hypothetical protein